MSVQNVSYIHMPVLNVSYKHLSVRTILIMQGHFQGQVRDNYYIIIIIILLGHFYIRPSSD